VVAQTYRDHNFPSPIHDADGKLAYLLSRVLRGYTNTNPSEKPQKAINPCVVWGLLHSTLTPEDIACGKLAGGAFFFAMHEVMSIYKSDWRSLHKTPVP
jgi:hypothetical protein